MNFNEYGKGKEFVFSKYNEFDLIEDIESLDNEIIKVLHK